MFGSSLKVSINELPP